MCKKCEQKWFCGKFTFVIKLIYKNKYENCKQFSIHKEWRNTSE